MLNVRCPRISWTSFRFRPRMTSQDAHVCRRSWNRKSVIFAARHTRSKPVRMLPHAAPLRVLNTPLALLSGKRDERLVHGLIHRDLAPATALRVLDLHGAAGEVDTLPREAEDFAASHPRV
jgi:hypothetical protein